MQRDNIVEKSAKSVEEAIELALVDLESEREFVDVEVLNEGSKGLLGIFGNKEAKVRVSLKAFVSIEKGKDFLEEVLKKMNVNARVETQVMDDNYYLRVNGEDVGILIGRRGETLEALQYVLGLVVNKHANRHQKVILDIEGYRDRREETLIKLAQRLAQKASKTKKSVALEPMSPYERRIIHSSLQENGSVSTYSVGDEPYRKIIIKPK